MFLYYFVVTPRVSRASVFCMCLRNDIGAKVDLGMQESAQFTYMAYTIPVRGCIFTFLP